MVADRAAHAGPFRRASGFQRDRAVFCGDVVMGWSSTLISPRTEILRLFPHAFAA